VEHDDARVIEGGGGAGFLEDAGAGVVVAGEDLEGHAPLELAVLGQEDAAHASLAEERFEGVVRDGIANFRHDAAMVYQERPGVLRKSGWSVRPGRPRRAGSRRSS
jgi:hypothetical protein